MTASPADRHGGPGAGWYLPGPDGWQPITDAEASEHRYPGMAHFMHDPRTVTDMATDQGRAGRLACRFQVKIGNGGINRNVSVRVQPWPWLPFLRFRVEADVSMPEGMAWDFSHSTYDPREADHGDPQPSAPLGR